MCFRSVGNTGNLAALSAWAATAMTSCDGQFVQVIGVAS
jgi:hypothetical protein